MIWHWSLRFIAAAIWLAWLWLTFDAPLFAEGRANGRAIFDRLQPDSAVRGFLEQAPRGGGWRFVNVDAAAPNRAEIQDVLRTYLPASLVGSGWVSAETNEPRVTDVRADAIVPRVIRVAVESAIGDRATVVATFEHLGAHRDEGLQEEYTFIPRRYDLRFEVARFRDGWRLLAPPPLPGR